MCFYFLFIFVLKQHDQIFSRAYYSQDFTDYLLCVLLKVYQRNRTNSMYLERHFLKSSGSQGYGAWDVPWSAVCKQETQERQWCWRPESLRTDGSEGLRTQSIKDRGGCASLLSPAESEVSLPQFLFSSGPQGIG